MNDELFFARKIEIENAETVKDYLNQFAEQAGPLITDQLKSQIKTKNKSGFSVFGSVIRADINQRVQIEVDIEPFHPAFHNEIYIRELPVIPITISKINQSLIDGLPDVIGQMENQRSIVETNMIDAGNHNPAHVIAGGRKIFMLATSGHVIQMVLIAYPEMMVPVENVLNHFFRKIPTIDPSKN